MKEKVIRVVAPNEKVSAMWLETSSIQDWSRVARYIQDPNYLRGLSGVLFIVNAKHIPQDFLHTIYEIIEASDEWVVVHIDFNFNQLKNEN